MDGYIARQPIFTRDMRVYGYELLFRNGSDDICFSTDDADQATSHVAIESFCLKGVDSITGGKPAFINFTTRLLAENTATLFPKDQLVVEILETVEPTSEIIKACSELHNKGYTIALDDFVYRPEFDPLINLSNIIKFDFLISSPQEISEMLKHKNVRGKRLLAEKIETFESFDLAVKMGFTLFQGYFFSKPVTLQTKALSPMKSNYISLLKEINTDDYIDYKRLAETIRTDVALSYKLLKLVNSSYYGLRHVVRDISQTIAIIGTTEMRKWVFMIALMGLSSDKPDELMKMSMIRGRFLELLNFRSKDVLPNDVAFQAGLFSMLDVLTDMPMSSALEGMCLAEEVHDALICHSGPLFDLIELVTSLERSNWNKTDELTALLDIEPGLVSKVYLEAVDWCNQMQF